MREPPQDNWDLKYAFPAALHDDALAALAAFPKNPYRWNSFSVKLQNETVWIPKRIYHNTALVQYGRLGGIQNQMLNCLLTRHHNGFIRQEHLGRIINSNEIWIVPYVIQLLGEYVVEILRVIEENLESLDRSLYAHFLGDNLGLLTLTEQRVISYWDCYYRFSCKKEDYPGFRAMRFFKQLIEAGS